MTNDKKQTAVEWLVDQVEQFYCLLPVDMIEQARAMEREQIEAAFQAEWTETNYCGKKYYESTYGKDGES